MQEIGQIVAGQIIGDAAKQIASAIAGRIGSAVKSSTRSVQPRKPRNRRTKRKNIMKKVLLQCNDINPGKIENITRRGHTRIRELVLDAQSAIQIAINPSGPLFTWVKKGDTMARGVGVYNLAISDWIGGVNNDTSYQQMYDEFATLEVLFDEFLVKAVSITFCPTNALKKGLCYPNSDIYIRGDFNMSLETTSTDLRTVDPKILGLERSTTKVYTFGRVGEQLNNAFNVSASSRQFHQWYNTPDTRDQFKMILNRYLDRCVCAIDMPLWGQSSSTEPGAYSVFDIKVKVLITLRGERDTVLQNPVNLPSQKLLEIPDNLRVLNQASLATRPLEADPNTQPANTPNQKSKKNHKQKRVYNHLQHKWEVIFQDPECQTDSDGDVE